MRKVKFNVTTEVHMIPDEIYQDFKDKMSEMKFKSFKDYQQRLLAGSEFEFRNVVIGEELEVPEWYFNIHKDDKLAIGIDLKFYKDAHGNPQPFQVNDAIKHGHMHPDEKVMKTVSRFELVEEAALTHKKNNQSRV